MAFLDVAIDQARLAGQAVIEASPTATHLRAVRHTRRAIRHGSYAVRGYIGSNLNFAYSLMDLWRETAAPFTRWQINPFGYYAARFARAGQETLIHHTKFRSHKPAFNIAPLKIGRRKFPVTEEVVLDLPFGQLRHFKSEHSKNGPTVLLVAPLSGHFATLLRGTVQDLLAQGMNVSITDWRDASTVPLEAGHFGAKSPITYIVEFARHLREQDKKRVHIISVCQPCMATLAALSILDEEKVTASATLIAGPVDPAAKENDVTRMVRQKPLSHFKNEMEYIPDEGDHKGAGRLVWVKEKHLAGFIWLKIEEHAENILKFFQNILKGDDQSANKHKSFYEEFLTGMNMPGQFVTGTIAYYKSALKHGSSMLARRALKWRDPRTNKLHTIDPSKIKRTRLFVVEAEKDHICAQGQTKAALDLCDKLPLYRKGYHYAPIVGHYGVFTGSNWRKDVLPRVLATIQLAEVEIGNALIAAAAKVQTGRSNNVVPFRAKRGAPKTAKPAAAAA